MSHSSLAPSTLTIEMHIMAPGHKCTNPYPKFPAANVKAGEMLGFHNWVLWYNKGMYRVSNRKDKAFDFSRFDCAAAKLHELGRAHASNNIDSFMSN